MLLYLSNNVVTYIVSILTSILLKSSLIVLLLSFFLPVVVGSKSFVFLFPIMLSQFLFLMGRTRPLFMTFY